MLVVLALVLDEELVVLVVLVLDEELVVLVLDEELVVLVMLDDVLVVLLLDEELVVLVRVLDFVVPDVELVVVLVRVLDFVLVRNGEGPCTWLAPVPPLLSAPPHKSSPTRRRRHGDIIAALQRIGAPKLSGALRLGCRWHATGCDECGLLRYCCTMTCLANTKQNHLEHI